MKRAVVSIFLSPHFLLVSFGVLYALLWHFSLIYLSPFSWLENRHQVERLFVAYLALHTFLVLIVGLWAHKRVGGPWLGIILVAGYCVFLAIRALDWNILYYYGSHVDALFWENAFYASGIEMMFTRVALLSLITVAVGAVVVITLLKKMVRHQAERAGENFTLLGYLAAYCVIPPFVVLLVGGVWIHAYFTESGTSNIYTAKPPEYHFFKSLYEYLQSGDVEKVELSISEKSKLASMGLPLETVSAEYPLYRDSVYLGGTRDLDVQKIPPNVILILVESLSSYFMEDPAMRELGITPNLTEFGQGTRSFSNIVNANTPTLQGQIATLASSLHLFRTTINLKRWGEHEDVYEQDSDREGSLMTRYPFISLLLKQHGYESVHVQGGDPGFADTANYFRVSASYDDFLSVATDKYADQREYELGPWGASDIDTFNEVTRWLEKRQGGPFFMSIATMDIHHPYYPVVEKPGVDNDLLNCVYSTDAGFGVFWEYFKKSRFKDNTIVIVTSDHALFPTSEYLEVRGEDIGYYDKIPLMIYSPFHAPLMRSVDDVRGSQLDIVPTLLELLGLDSHNSFIGLSLLSDRREYPYLFGKVNLESRMSQVGEVSWNNDEQTKLIKYIRYLASINKLYPQSDR